MSYSYYSVHNHSEFSNVKLLDCIIKVEDLINGAIDKGYKGIAVTDHEVLSSGVELLEIRDKIKEKHPDFKIIFGNEIYLIKDEEYKNTGVFPHFILLALDDIGYQQLKTLSSRAWDRSYFEKGQTRVPTFYSDLEDVVKNNQGHLVASTACLGGAISRAILAQDAEAINNFIPWLVDVFGKGNIFLEMQPAINEEQSAVNSTIVELSEYFGVDYIVTTDTHYLDKEDIDIHHAYLNSRESKERETFSFYQYTYMMTTEEVKSNLLQTGLTQEQADRAISNTALVGERAQEFDFRHPTIIPLPKVPEFKVLHTFKQWYDKYPYLQKYAEAEHEQDRYFMHLVEKGLVDLEVELTEAVAERVNIEMEVLWNLSEHHKQPMSAYSNLVSAIIDIIWNSSIVGCGRGSSISFLTNYLLKITQVNPMDYNIPYWRYLNPARLNSLADIDSDVCPEHTETILQELREHFGKDNVLNCATFKTESTKSAVLTAARGHGINNDEAQALAQIIPITRGKVHTLHQCLFGDEEQDILPVPGFAKAFDNYPGLLDTVKKIEGLRSNASIHASAVYIFNDGYLAHNSLMRAPNGTPITAFNMDDSDKMGALKFDLLRTDAQSKLLKTLYLLLEDGLIEWQGSLRATYDKYLHPKTLEYSDKKMWEKAADGKIMNLFQFEGGVGETCIRRTRPTSVAEMGAANAVMRLQSNEGQQPIDRYVAFKEDIGLWYREMRDWGLTEEEIKVLEKHLGHKYGNAIEQEDIMLMLIDEDIAGFTLGESDMARRVIAKKRNDEVAKLKKLFYEKGLKGGKNN